MKKFFLIFGFAIILLTSCGQDTMNWPHISFEFLDSSVTAIAVTYIRNENKYADYKKDCLVTNDFEKISYLLESIKGFPIKEEKEKSIETSSYVVNIVIDFYLDEKCDNKTSRLVYYCYGISDGKIMLNNGDVHFIPGRFEVVYEDLIR